MSMHPETAVALLRRATGEVMEPDVMRAALDPESSKYDPALTGRLMAYAERERLARANKSDDPHAGRAFR